MHAWSFPCDFLVMLTVVAFSVNLENTYGLGDGPQHWHSARTAEINLSQ